MERLATLTVSHLTWPSIYSMTNKPEVVKSLVTFFDSFDWITEFLQRTALLNSHILHSVTLFVLKIVIYSAQYSNIAFWTQPQFQCISEDCYLLMVSIQLGVSLWFLLCVCVCVCKCVNAILVFSDASVTAQHICSLVHSHHRSRHRRPEVYHQAADTAVILSWTLLSRNVFKNKQAHLIK